METGTNSNLPMCHWYIVVDRIDHINNKQLPSKIYNKQKYA